MDNRLMIRDPGLEFLSRGPPADLAARLRAFSSRAEMRGKEAEKLAGELRLARSLHSKLVHVELCDGMAQAALRV